MYTNRYKKKRPIANIMIEDFPLRHTTELWILYRHLWMKNKIACNILLTDINNYFRFANKISTIHLL